MNIKHYSDVEIAKIKKFPQFRCMLNYEGFIPYNSSLEVSMEENPLLDVIFGIDEKKGAPRGDLSMYLSEKTSPEVRAFISQQLMRDFATVSETGLPSDFDGDISQLIREKGETLDEYQSRLSSFLRSQFEQQERESELAKRVEPKVEPKVE